MMFAAFRYSIGTACAVAALAAVMPRAADAQSSPVVTQVQRMPNGSYRMLIDGQPFLAISPQAADSVLKLEAALRAVTAERDGLRSVAESAEATVRVHQEYRARAGEHVAALEAQAVTLERAVDIYKRLANRGAWVTIDVGAGATKDADPALLAGVGIRRLRIWAFLQEGNPGGFVGLQLPVF